MINFQFKILINFNKLTKFNKILINLQNERLKIKFIKNSVFLIH